MNALYIVKVEFYKACKENKKNSSINMHNYVLHITIMFCIFYKQSAGETNQQTVVQIHNTVFTYTFLITQI